ncbi:helix-turn-helix domain-containing protein [Enterococcus italicus]|uniref:helix-turn-helix domain-containing protein n=1 Tax=Enterococcus italicus TaxID=246144 RepID=UPI002073AA8B|nr:helix-turn-helix transcriptional regulator [Enterococcus italicus]
MGRKPISEFDVRLREEIARNLLKVTKGKTQSQISDLTGIPASTLSGYFTKRSTITEENAQKIADAFHIDKSDIDPRFKPNFKFFDDQLTDKHFELVKESEIKYDLKSMLDGAVSFDGKKLSDKDKAAILGYIEGRMNKD